MGNGHEAGQSPWMFHLVDLLDPIQFDLMNACCVRVECRHKDTLLFFQQQLLKQRNRDFIHQ